MITISSKNIGDVKEKRCGDFKETFESLNEKYIKKNLRCDDGL